MQLSYSILGSVSHCRIPAPLQTLLPRKLSRPLAFEEENTFPEGITIVMSCGRDRRSWNQHEEEKKEVGDVEHRKMRHCVKEHRNGEEGKREKKKGHGGVMRRGIKSSNCHWMLWVWPMRWRHVVGMALLFFSSVFDVGKWRGAGFFYHPVGQMNRVGHVTGPETWDARFVPLEVWEGRLRVVAVLLWWWSKL